MQDFDHIGMPVTSHDSLKEVPDTEDLQTDLNYKAIHDAPHVVQPGLLDEAKARQFCCSEWGETSRM
eukprot:5501541-Prorocentrum_lima.AAC.1